MEIPIQKRAGRGVMAAPRSPMPTAPLPGRTPSPFGLPPVGGFDLLKYEASTWHDGRGSPLAPPCVPYGASPCHGTCLGGAIGHDTPVSQRNGSYTINGPVPCQAV
jgi:hypothetical protein